MRILIDLQGAQSSGSRNRGIGRYTISLAQAIVRNKGSHEVIIALSSLFPDSIEPIRADFDTLLEQDKIQIWYAPGPVSSLETANSFRRKSAELVREAFIANLKPDMVLVTSLFEGLTDDAVTSVGNLSLNIPTSVILYDLIPLINRAHYLENPMVEAWYENKVDHLRRADLILAISESSRQEGINYLNFPSEQTVNISTAADPQFSPQNIGKKREIEVRKSYGLTRQFVMYTGGIDHRKNIEGLIRAYTKLAKPLRTSHQLAIVCSIHPPSRAALKALAEELGLAADELVLTGFVPENDLVTLYNLCKVFIFPSWHEGFGLPALEAMSCGRAVIGANTSSLPEVIGYDDAMFDPFNDNSITDKLTQVLSNHEFRHLLEQHGLKQSKLFSWDVSAKATLTAIETWCLRNTRISTGKLSKQIRPKLAFISPIPPERSGISDYSAELLPELARHYEIDVVTPQKSFSNPWTKSNCQVRTVEWFLSHSDEYDRILYHFGNSDFHQHMFDLIKKVPGVVVLHDFFLSGIIAHMDFTGYLPGNWVNELYRSHGYIAVQERFATQDSSEIIWRYPCNLSVLQDAIGIIVHSEYSKKLSLQWYGPEAGRDMVVIPLLREATNSANRTKARRTLGLSEDIFLVCSFGMLAPTKLNHRLLDAWILSKLAKNEKSVLVFVGEVHGAYGDELVKKIKLSGLSDRITITGWTDSTKFRNYLAAADVGVQLRSMSRGETSAAVLDCMNFSLPTIVNENGSMVDLPSNAVWKLPDEFEDAQLLEALETLWQNPTQRNSLGIEARKVLRTRHSPRVCSDQYTRSIESMYGAYAGGTKRLTHMIGALENNSDINHTWEFQASTIALSTPQRIQPRQLLVDISELICRDSGTGIQRMVREVLHELLRNPPPGHRVEPVYATPDQGYRYARKFTLEFLHCPVSTLVDDIIEFSAGDHFLGLDFRPEVVLRHETSYTQMRHHGVQVQFVIYDLLVVLQSHNFQSGSSEWISRWLEIITKFDGAVCISKSVAIELFDWLQIYGQPRYQPLNIGYFHLGANITINHLVESKTTDNLVLSEINSRQTFLMVGTIEPRKAHAQALEAFQQLWTQGTDINLVILGRKGWMTDVLIQKIINHPQNGKKLFWLNNVSDEYLEKIYSATTCLIAASEGEGFGLPLIEAARHNLPIIARDIPVFREVAAEHAFYFSGFSSDALACAITDWIALEKLDKTPKSSKMTWLTWKQSTKNLLDLVLEGQWQSNWMPDGVQRFLGSDSRFSTHVGKRIAREMTTSRQEGYLIFGPYIPLTAGQYQVVIYGKSSKGGTAGARMDVVCNGGGLVVGESVLNESDNGCLVALTISIEIPCTDLEIRVWVSKDTNLQVSMIEIAPWKQSFVHHFWAADRRIGTQVGERIALGMATTGQAGYLLFGPYIPLPLGRYQFVIRGVLGQNSANGAKVDVAMDQGRTILGECRFAEVGANSDLVSMVISIDIECTDLEVRVWVNETTNLQISMIEIIPLQDKQQEVEIVSTQRELILIKDQFLPSVPIGRSNADQLNLHQSSTHKPLVEMVFPDVLHEKSTYSDGASLQLSTFCNNANIPSLPVAPLIAEKVVLEYSTALSALVAPELSATTNCAKEKISKLNIDRNRAKANRKKKR